MNCFVFLASVASCVGACCLLRLVGAAPGETARRAAGRVATVGVLLCACVRRAAAALRCLINPRRPHRPTKPAREPDAPFLVQVPLYCYGARTSCKFKFFQS